MKEFFTIADAYKQQILKDGMDWLFNVGKFSSVRGCLVAVYNELVLQKKCIPIDKLPKEDKAELWKEAKRVSTVQEQDYLIEVAKAIHGLSSYIQLNR